MMTRSRRRMLLGTGVAMGLGLVLLFFAPRKSPTGRETGTHAGGASNHSGSENYSTQPKARQANTDAAGVVQVDKSIQMSFDGDPKISPGSLQEMTAKMREAEIEVATQLNRKIEVP